MTFNTIIVEDEILARKTLERLCEKSSHIELKGSFENAESALEYLEKEQIDLIFLDIEMPDGMSGIDLIDNIPYLPQIIITSSNTSYAFEAFEYDLTDYLKKPATQDRFTKAVNKAIEREKILKADLDSLAASSAAHELYIKSDGRYSRVAYDDILYFENAGDYVKVVTNDKSYIIYGALKAIDKKLKYPRFLKVHRSFIVNLNKIVDIEDNSLVIGSKLIPISRAHKPVLMNNLNIL